MRRRILLKKESTRCIRLETCVIFGVYLHGELELKGFFLTKILLFYSSSLLLLEN
jgi:hypothetical protein